MTRNTATTIENNFVLGLVTERTELRFPQNAATDLDNCVIDLYGRISRRPGLDLEENYQATSVTIGTTRDSFTEYLWEGAGGNSDSTLLVQQHGKTLSFFNLGDSIDVGPNVLAHTIDLTAYIPASSGENPASNPCCYTAGNGKLVVTNEATNPIFVTFIGGIFTVTPITINIRDFKGLDDGLALNTRVTDSVAGLVTDNVEHYYNLLNQGWFTGDALSQWDTARTDMPSNADIVGLFRASATDSFDNAIVTSKAPGSSHAPKGHFILDAFNPNRTTAMSNEGFSATVDVVTLVDRTLGSNIGDMSGGGGLAASFDGNFLQNAAHSSSTTTITGYIGKNYTAASGSKIAGVNVVFATDTAVGFFNTQTVYLYAKASAPSSGTDGTLLGQGSVSGNPSSPLFIASNDSATTFNYFWVYIVAGTTPPSFFPQAICELQFYSKITTTQTIVYRRPSVCSFFQGRAFYAGTNALDVSTKIYFTRIIESDDHFNQCYSDNDPTSETLNDFLPSDGGVISIPECGLITKLIVTQSSLLVLATNGVWIVGGSSGLPFQATNYTVQRLSTIGSQSPQSVVDYKGTPIWWGDNGIYTVQFDPNFNSYTVVDMTLDTIKSFYIGIPAVNRQEAKGVYDTENDTIYFIYNDGEDLTGTPTNTYNRALVFVPRSKAFYPWSFPDSRFYIRGILYVRDGVRAVNPAVKYVVTDVTNSLVGDATATLYYSEVFSDTYKDWSTYADVVSSNPLDEINYTSYFLTGYYIHGETQRFFQGNYLFVFLDQDLQGSCLVKTIYDWTTSGNSGKWSPDQQVYPDWQSLQAINYRRLKTRGKGKAMQLYFESEEGKPFSILGWSVFESGNASI